MRKLIIAGLVLVATAVAGAAPSTYEEAVQSANTSYSVKHYAEAREATEQALKLAKTPAEKSGALSHLGEAYNAEKKYTQAREAWAQVLALPDVPADGKAEIELAIGGTYADENDFAAAREAYARVASNPQVKQALKFKAQTATAFSYQSEKNFAKAREEFEKLVSNPEAALVTRVLARNQIGETYFSEGNFARAREEFTKGLGLGTLNPVQEAVLRVRVADTYRSENNPTKAASEISRFRNDTSKRMESAFASQNWKEARDLTVAYLATGPLPTSDTFFLREKIGETYLAEKNTAEARKQFEALVAATDFGSLAGQDLATIHAVQQLAQLAIAHSYELDGNKQRAKAEYQKLLKMPDLPTPIKVKAEQQLAALS